MAEVTSTTPTYDYSSIGSIGSDAVQSVNGEMINKLRAKEEIAVIDPITTKIENITKEKEKLEEIKTKVTEFQDIVKFFDIYNQENVFNQKHFDTAGTAAVYDAVDTSTLQDGTTSINITQLAQKDVYQSFTFSDSSANVASGTLSIQIGSNTATTFDTSSGMTYKELATEINKTEGLTASVEQVGDNSYRLIVKSTNTGTENKLTISGLDLGFVGDYKFTSDSITASDSITGNLELNGVIFTNNGNPGQDTYSDLVSQINAHADFSASINDNNQIEITRTDGSVVSIDNNTLSSGLNFTAENTNNTLQAQNLNATIDGVDYNTSSNSITTQANLKITAIEVGTSKITISKDTSAVTVAAEAMATKYNELNDIINTELNDPDSTIEDKSSLRGILSDIKNLLFNSYGAETPTFGTQTDEYGDIIYAHSNVTNNDKNIFMFGFELDKTGKLSVDKDKFNTIVDGTDPNYNFDDLKAVFTGSYENKGLGVQIEEYLDDLDTFSTGLFYIYEEKMTERETKLKEEKKEELENLDSKYGIMAQQFSAYSALIAQMEASFGGLQMMIAQSQAK